MLILVGVTINVALNGGLFEKAKNASTQTQREADKEELLSAIFGTADNNGNLNIGSLTINGWTKSVAKQDTDSKTYYEFTSAKENKFYVYAETGKILDTEPIQIQNVWINRGLTSSNVQFDYAYYNAEQNAVIGIMRNGDYNFIFNGNPSGMESNVVNSNMSGDNPTVFVNEDNIIFNNSGTFFKLTFNNENSIKYQYSTDGGLNYSDMITFVKQDKSYSEFLESQT